MEYEHGDPSIWVTLDSSVTGICIITKTRKNKFIMSIWLLCSFMHDINVFIWYVYHKSN
jgi:hypothetical protein